jgi:hypothetical protein
MIHFLRLQVLQIILIVPLKVQMNLPISLIMLVEAHPLLFDCDGVKTHRIFDHFHHVKAVDSQLALSLATNYLEGHMLSSSQNGYPGETTESRFESCGLQA